MRFPCGRNQSSAERASVQCPLRTQFLFTPIVSKKVADDGMPRPGPEAAAIALIVAWFVFQFRIPERRQAVGRDELSFARCETLRIPSPAVVPLRGRAARL